MKHGLWRLAWMCVGFVVASMMLVQGLAHVSWLLADAGRHDLEWMRAHTPADFARERQIGTHEVREWEGERAFTEAPELARRVEAGELEPVEQRLPEDPLVIDPPEQMGPYGGTWTRYANSVGDINSLWGNRLTYEGPVRWDAMGERVLPNLARDWEVKEDGRVYVLHLRRGVRWSDGEPFDADDIMFWYEHVLTNEQLTPTVTRELRPGGEVVEVTRIDDYTVRFEFAVPHGLFIERSLASNITDAMFVPSHYMRQFHKDTVEPAPGEELEEGELPARFRAQMVERGYEHWYRLYQYMNRWQNPDRPTLRAWKLHRPPPSRPVIFVRNPYYWKVDPEGRQLPYIDRLSFEVFDLEIITMRAMEGRMDMQKRHVRFENYPILMMSRERGNYQVRQWIKGSGSDLIIAPNYNHLDPDTQKLMRDPRFRKALSLALDRETMNLARYFGQAYPRQAAATSRSPFYDPQYESVYIEYDPQRAVELLEEIGLERRDRDGRWVGYDGRPLHFRIDVTNTPSGGDVLVDLIADAWSAIGIRTDVNRLARSLWNQRRLAKMHDFVVWEGEWEDNPVIQPRWYIPWNPFASMQASEQALWFMTDGEEGEEPTGDLRRVVDVYREIEAEHDHDNRVELFKEISRLNAENLWVIGTVGQAPVPVVVHNDMRNVPEVALSSWEARSPANTAPEGYALDRAD